MAPLLWTGTMLGPTILAADAPHFLRASSLLLPDVIILPAIGLAQLCGGACSCGGRRW
ncbi:MAG: hypothetical protein H6669_05465 [Ardenticatenaceae bacterium]|nr:hypothetical protein [Ardenticatenaceae bacterium]